MNRNLLFSLLVAVVFFSIFSCSSSKKAQNETAVEEVSQIIVPDTFVLPDLPAELTNPDARAEYLVMHYWDRFDFSDEKLILRPEITEQAFVDYVNILPYAPLVKAEESLIHTLKKAEANGAVYRNFGTLFDKYFYEPNSPFRNEEFYIPVLRSITKSNLLSESEKSHYQFQLEMALKNRVGEIATDFTYTQASGQLQKMHFLKSEYLILMFSNPDCATCAAVTDRLVKSEAINHAFSMNTPSRTMITILTVYPDADVDGWRARLPHMPANWMHSYDNGMVISKQKLYDLKATPALYLLDKNKKIILKDTSVEAIESFFTAP